MGRPLATIPDIDTIVAAITALLLWTKAVLRIPIASPVRGAVLSVIIVRILFCHSKKMSLKPLFTPSKEEMKRKIPKTRTIRRRTFLLERIGTSSKSKPLLDIHYAHPWAWFGSCIAATNKENTPMYRII
jgi:hypothetical protein